MQFPSRFWGCIGLAFSSPSQGLWRLVLWTPQWHSCQRFSGRRRYSRSSWLPSGLPGFSVLLYQIASCAFPPHHIPLHRAASLVDKDGLWWLPGGGGLGSGQLVLSWLLEGKLCAPGGGRAAGSALHELGGLGSVTFPVEAKVKIQNSLHGKGAQACQSGLLLNQGPCSTWVQPLPWRWTGGAPVHGGSDSAIAAVLTPCCCLSPGSVKGGILLLPQCTAVHTRAHVLYLA